MKGIFLIGLCFVIQASAQRVIGIADPYYSDRRIIDPGVIDGGVIGGGIIDRGIIGRGIIGGDSLSSSADICRIYGEYAMHDIRGYVETCRYSCDQVFATCRRRPGSLYGICCSGRSGIHGGGFRDQHCLNGSPSAGYCNFRTDCPHGGHHYRCEINSGGLAFGIHSRRGLCCRISRVYPLSTN